MNESVDQVLASVREHQEAGRARTALELLDSIDLDQVAIASEIVNVGYAYSDLEQFDRALLAFERAIDCEPSLATAYSARAQVLSAIGRLEEAIAALEAAILLRPTSARFVLLSDAQVRLGREAEAEASLGHALQIDPDDEEALYNLAILVRAREPADAVKMLERALELDPTYAEAHRELGLELLRAGEQGAALEHLDRAVMFAPDDMWSRVYLATMYAQIGRSEDADRCLLIARTLAPLSPVPLYLTALHEERHGSAEAALEWLRKAVATDAKDPNAAYHLGRLLSATGRRHMAIQLLRDSLARARSVRSEQLLSRLESEDGESDSLPRPE